MDFDSEDIRVYWLAPSGKFFTVPVGSAHGRQFNDLQLDLEENSDKPDAMPDLIEPTATLPKKPLNQFNYYLDAGYIRIVNEPSNIKADDYFNAIISGDDRQKVVDFHVKPTKAQIHNFMKLSKSFMKF